MSKLLLYNDAGLCKINSSTGGVGMVVDNQI